MLDLSVWKMAGTAMASMLVTGLAAWFSFGAGTVSRAEMEAYVAKTIEHEREIRAPFVDAMQGVQNEFNAFRMEQKATNAKLETLIEVMRSADEAARDKN